MPKTTTEESLERIADALESIAEDLTQLASILEESSDYIEGNPRRGRFIRIVSID